ncbi:hypothetical protein OKW22_000179 [Bacilli bacterium PM5-3]|nr:hypothetical protein [Bacilli bacterium PM5-3]MDH6603444.1 hypothetical protein [Bacilli bacterium PM5-9]
MEDNRVKPWQFGVPGLVLGFFLGLIPFIFSLYGNYQFNQGKDVSDLKKVYNIILIVCAVLVLIWLIFIITMVFAAANSATYY